MRKLVLSLIATFTLAGCNQSQQPDTSFDIHGETKEEHGRRIAGVLGCTGCHGANLAGKDWSAPDFITIWTSNLSVELPKYDDAAFRRALQRGYRHDGSEMWDMPSFLFSELSEGDVVALSAYLRKVPPTGKSHPRPILLEQALKEIKQGIYKSSATEAKERAGTFPPDAGPEHKLGRYIARATCAECHGMDLRGGEPYPGAARRPDIRMVAAYEKTDFANFMQSGKAAGGRELPLMSGVARGRYSKFTKAEVDALYEYLKAVSATNP
jgi:cytochrome c553